MGGTRPSLGPKRQGVAISADATLYGILRAYGLPTHHLYYYASRRGCQPMYPQPRSLCISHRRSTTWCARPSAASRYMYPTTRPQSPGGVGLAAWSRHHRKARSMGSSLRRTGAAATAQLPRLCSQAARRACRAEACCRRRDQPQRGLTREGRRRRRRRVRLT